MNNETKEPRSVHVIAIALIALLATPGIVAAAAAPKPLAGARAPVHLVSPYARAAAAQQARAGQAPAGHSPTRVQGMGILHKPHSGSK